MPEKYLSIGQFFNTDKAIGGELDVFETDSEYIFRVEGTITRDNVPRVVKGFSEHETIGNKLVPTLLLFELPIREGANNIIYKLKGESPVKYKKLDPAKYGKIISPKEFMLTGKYFGNIFSEASIEPLGEDSLADDKDSAIKEFIFPEIDFDPSKGIYVNFTLDKIK